MGVRAFLFREGGLDTAFRWRGTLPELGQQELLWLDVQGEEQATLESLAEQLSLQGRGRTGFLNCAETLDCPATPELHHYSDHVQLCVQAPTPSGGLSFGAVPVHLLVYGNLIVTVHAAPAPFLDELENSLPASERLGELDSAAFLAVMLNFHLESFYDLLAPLEDGIDDLDARVLGYPDRPHLAELVRLRQRVSDVRRLLGAHRLVYAGLASPNFTVFQGDQPEQLLTRLLKGYEHAYDGVSHTRDMILGSFDLYMTSTGQRTNEIMRVLTIVTVILGVMAVVTGVFGTNFEGLHVFKTGEAGFRAMLIGTGVLIVGVLGLGRWRRWL